MFFKYLENHKFLAFSHRGGALENKENTIDAFQKSIEIGYQYIETDVQCTKDDRLIIFHDNDLLRINNQNIKISEILYEVIVTMTSGASLWIVTPPIVKVPAGISFRIISVGRTAFISLNISFSPLSSFSEQEKIDNRVMLRTSRFIYSFCADLASMNNQTT